MVYSCLCKVHMPDQIASDGFGQIAGTTTKPRTSLGIVFCIYRKVHFQYSVTIWCVTSEIQTETMSTETRVTNISAVCNCNKRAPKIMVIVMILVVKLSNSLADIRIPSLPMK